jgi:Putative peptidoglycan binding domain
MGKLAGLLMIAAGVGTAAYVYPLLGTGADRSDRQLADVVSITTGAVPAGQPVPTRPPTVVVRPSGQDAQRVVSAETSPGKLPLTTQAPKSPALAAVVPAPSADAPVARPIEVPQPMTAKRLNRADDDAKIALTRDIQRELKRVGCYDGATDGAWSPETRQAMKQFIDRVNASLPVDDADHILKTLVQGHPGNACGRSCPTGQAISGDGKCIPTAIIAAPKRALPTREAAAQPQAAPSQSSPAAKASSWEPKIIPAPEPVQKPQVAAIAEPRTAEVKPAEVKVDRDPLPGRTSLGATGVPSPSAPAPVTQAPAEPRAKRPVIVVKPAARDNSDNSATASLPTPAPAKPAPSIGAIAAIEAPEKPERRERERARPAPPAPVVYRAPPPPPQRYVSTYTPPPVYRERPRFGPQIFRDLERNGR